MVLPEVLGGIHEGFVVIPGTDYSVVSSVNFVTSAISPVSSPPSCIDPTQ